MKDKYETLADAAADVTAKLDAYFEAREALLKMEEEDPGIDVAQVVSDEAADALGLAVNKLSFLLGERAPAAPRRYPDGRICASDEGEMDVRIHTDRGNVVIDFGKPIAWLGMPPSYVREFIKLLEKYAARARRT